MDQSSPQRPASRKDCIRTDPPHPTWKPGDKQPLPFSGDYISLTPKEMGGSACYPLVISAVVPRPIGFISSISSEGQVNLSPYSYFGAMGHDPPLVAVSCCRSGVRGGGKKDTLANILATREFVVNIMSEWFVEAANHTCGPYDAGQNEFEIAGLTPLPSVAVAPPRVAESAVHMECTLRHHWDVKNDQGVDTTTVLLAEIVKFHVHEGVSGTSPSGRTVVDPVKLKPISRLGGNTYGVVKELFDLPRPDREAQGRVL